MNTLGGSLYVRTQAVDDGDRTGRQAPVFGDNHVDVLFGSNVVENLEMMQVFCFFDPFQDIGGVCGRIFGARFVIIFGRGKTGFERKESTTLGLGEHFFGGGDLVSYDRV